MALGSTQLLTEMSTRGISWEKGGRYVRLTTLPPSCAIVMKSGNLSFLELSGPPQAFNGTPLPLPLLSAYYTGCISTNTSITSCSKGLVFVCGEKQQRTAAPLVESVSGSAARSLSKKRYLLVARIFIDD